MARESDFLLGFAFTLETQGSLTGVFQEISGLGSENELVEQKNYPEWQGSDPENSRPLEVHRCDPQGRYHQEHGNMDLAQDGGRRQDYDCP